MATGYRYASARKVGVIRATTPWRVPNVDLAGRPKVVHFTWDLYTSASAAEHALQIGTHHPAGPFSSPAGRLDLDLTGVSYRFLGAVPGGTGAELTTAESPLVTAITPLGP